MTEHDFEDFEIPWEFSEKELSQLDPVLSPSSGTSETEAEGGPRLSISLESESHLYEKAEATGHAIQIPREAEPPYDTYRAHRGFLSVTDLVAPAW